jgi:hypothetical protein
MKRAWLFGALLACGVEVVELAPDADLLVIGEVPRDAIARFATSEAAPDPKMLALRYPSNGVVLPANIAPILFAWEGDKAATFELTLRANERSLRVYTRDTSVTIPVERWRTLLAAGALTVELRSLTGPGMKMLRSAEPRTVTVRPALDGTLYFTSPMATERAQLGELRGSTVDERARALGSVRAGRIARVGPRGIELEDRMLPVPEGVRIAHPSWSPDGNALVITYWPAELKLADDASDEHEGSRLARLALDGTFTPLQVMGAESLRRARYAPDGRTLACEGGKLDAPELFLVASEGGMARRLACSETNMGMMPKKDEARAPAWLGDAWLAFVSKRMYLDPPRELIWVAELSREEARCAAPFWLPAQDAQRDYEALFFE